MLADGCPCHIFDDCNRMHIDNAWHHADPDAAFCALQGRPQPTAVCQRPQQPHRPTLRLLQQALQEVLVLVLPHPPRSVTCAGQSVVPMLWACIPTLHLLHLWNMQVKVEQQHATTPQTGKAPDTASPGGSDASLTPSSNGMSPGSSSPADSSPDGTREDPVIIEDDDDQGRPPLPPPPSLPPPLPPLPDKYKADPDADLPDEEAFEVCGCTNVNLMHMCEPNVNMFIMCKHAGHAHRVPP